MERLPGGLVAGHADVVEDDVDPLQKQVDDLEVATANGIWVVHSSSNTAYYIDCDRRLVMRKWGPGSSRFDFDDVWVPLVDLLSRDENLNLVDRGHIRVGERPEYLTDPRGGAGDNEWRVQRAVTSIERADEEQVTRLKTAMVSTELDDNDD